MMIPTRGSLMMKATKIAYALRMRAMIALAFSCACAGSFAVWGCSDDRAAEPTDGGPPDVGADGPLDAGSADGSVSCASDPQSEGMYQHLQCAGLYSDFAAKTVAPENRPFKPALEFWSDGAEKSRFVYLPPGTKIDIASFDQWIYPNGTKLWKEFRVGGKRIETRLYVKSPSGAWVHTVYRWNAAETDAVRDDGGEVVKGIGPNGSDYEVPSTGQCGECHDNRPEPPLGFDALGLGLAGATGVTLAALAAENAFTGAPPATSLSIPDDPNAPTTGRLAAGWLSTNCGSCHNAIGMNGGGFTGLHLLIRPSELLDGGNFATLDVSRTGMCCYSTRSNPNDAGMNIPRLAGGDVESSLAAYLSGRRDPVEPNSIVQMPPLVTRAVDTAGHKLLTDWIAARPACTQFTDCP